MYSPKISEKFIPMLYRLAKAQKRPMTFLVNQAVEQYLAKEKEHEGTFVRDHRNADSR